LLVVEVFRLVDGPGELRVPSTVDDLPHVRPDRGAPFLLGHTGTPLRSASAISRAVAPSTYAMTVSTTPADDVASAVSEVVALSANS
jgi:hypothetical protein